MPLSDNDWKQLLASPRQPVSRVRAMTLLEQYDTISLPIRVAVDSGSEYVAKCPLVGNPSQYRRLITERVLAGMAFRMGAPVVEPVFVEIGQDFLDVNPDLKEYIAPGLAHATRFIPGCVDSRHVIRESIMPNKARLSALAIFYGWGHANDAQFIYQTNEPPLVHSVDHGEFLPSGASWTHQTLETCLTCEPFALIVDEAFLIAHDLVPSRTKLAKLTDDVIAEVVAGVPQAWWSDDAERVALCQFCARRRDQLGLRA